MVTTVDEVVATTLRNSGLTLSVAESCSGGLIAKRITDIPGSSGYFLFGAVTYSNAAKERILGVPAELIETYGAVSSEVALAMAEGVRRASGSDIAIATTGIAGPGGGSEEKPVGTVFIAMISPDGAITVLHHFEGDRNSIREATAEEALSLLLGRIASPPPP